jgi:hypothetical protein
VCRLVEASQYGEEKVRQAGCGLLLLVFTSMAFAGERYIEVWNPPEAQGGVHQSRNASQPLKQRHTLAHAGRTRVRHIPAPVPKLAMTHHAPADVARSPAPDMSQIPRQITPEGNVLRVDSRRYKVEVSR